MFSEKGMRTNAITKEKHLLIRQQPNARIRFGRLVRWEAQVSAQPARVFDLVVQDRDSRGMKFAPVAGKRAGEDVFKAGRQTLGTFIGVMIPSTFFVLSSSTP
jgi:hypothetical protein